MIAKYSATMGLIIRGVIITPIYFAALLGLPSIDRG